MRPVWGAVERVTTDNTHTTPTQWAHEGGVRWLGHDTGRGGSLEARLTAFREAAGFAGRAGDDCGPAPWTGVEFVYALLPLAAAAILKGNHEWSARILGARDAVAELAGVGNIS
jgi:hypothetical protein